MATSTGSSLLVFKEVVEVFANYTLEASQQDTATPSTGELLMAGRLSNPIIVHAQRLHHLSCHPKRPQARGNYAFGR